MTVKAYKISKNRLQEILSLVTLLKEAIHEKITADFEDEDPNLNEMVYYEEVSKAFQEEEFPDLKEIYQ